jgi:hypothetical protein
VGWHTFRHFVGSMLAEMGEHQLTIRDYLRHANLHVTNKYLQAASQTKTAGTREVGGGYSAFRAALEEQIQPGPVSNGLMDPNGPKSFFEVLCN